MDPKLEAASGDERGALNQPRGLAVNNTAQKKKFIIIGILVLSLIVIASLGYYLVRNGSLPDAIVPDILQLPKEEVAIKEIIAEEDLAARYASTTKTMDERIEQLYIALQTSGNTSIPPYTPSDTKLALKTWNTPDPETEIEDGAAFSADGTYSIPANWFGFITIYENGTPIGRQVLDNRDKADTTTTFSIPLGNYIPGLKEYRMEIEGAAACRLACSPSDEDCHVENATYCGEDSKKEDLVIYKTREVGVNDLFSAETCIMRTFESGPLNSNARNSCSTEGFVQPFMIDAEQFINVLTKSNEVKKKFTLSISEANKKIQNQNHNFETRESEGAFTWNINYKNGESDDGSSCRGSITVKYACPLK